jgi:acetoin utilization protein AcuB
MKTPVFSVSSTDPVEAAALIMEEKKVSGLTVVDDGKVVGIMTITDILRAFVSALGLREGGTRVTIKVPNEPGVLERVASAGPPSNISAVVSSAHKDGSLELVLRVNGDEVSSFAERLKAKGIDVSDVR